MYLPLYTPINISMKIVIVTGGFDPLHSGHISYLTAAKKLGDKLVVGLNSDAWLARKKGRHFMPITERFAIVSAINVVDEVIVYNDDDGSSIDAIKLVKLRYPNSEIIFANGGDRTATNIPEMTVQDVIFKFGVGGEDKKNSSSWILEEWKKPKTDRPWGYYRVLHEVDRHVKLKELTVLPGQRLSMQRHEQRAEFWFVAEGQATVYTVNPHSTEYELLDTPSQHEHCWIELGAWHQLCNETDQPLRLIEIQYGADCVEEDIKRQ